MNGTLKKRLVNLNPMLIAYAIVLLWLLLTTQWRPFFALVAIGLIVFVLIKIGERTIQKAYREVEPVDGERVTKIYSAKNISYYRVPSVARIEKADGTIEYRGITLIDNKYTLLPGALRGMEIHERLT